MTKPTDRIQSTSNVKPSHVDKATRLVASKRPENAPLIVRGGLAGTQKLVPAAAIPTNGITKDMLAWIKKLIEEAVAGIDQSMLFEISSGSLATFAFRKRIHKDEGLTQVEFSLKYFGRSDRTVLGWRQSHKIWTRLGDQLDCPPSNYSQLLSLKKVKPEHQKEIWNTLVRRLGRAPTGWEIEELAGATFALLPTSSKGGKLSSTSFELGHIDARLRAIAEEMRKMAASKIGDDSWKRVGQLAEDIEKCLKSQSTEAKENTETSASSIGGVKASKELNMAA